MHRTYQAILNGNRIEWQGPVPPQHGPTRVQITLVEESQASAVQRKQNLLNALEALAASGAFNEIKDPTAWQREMRSDRPLADREE